MLYYDGDVIETVEARNNDGSLNRKVVTHVRGNRLLTTIDTDENGDGAVDRAETIQTFGDAVKFISEAA